MNDTSDNFTDTGIPKIQSAGNRFRRRQDSRLTNVQLRMKKSPWRSRAKHDENNRGTSPHKARPSLMHEAVNDLRQTLSQEGLDLPEQDLQGNLQDIPKKPDFPYFIFSIALIKDIIDVPANLMIFGVVISFALSLIFSLILFFWFLGKLNGAWWKRALIKKLILRFILCATIETLPFASILPASTILVLMVYYREKKVVILINEALQKLHGKKL